MTPASNKDKVISLCKAQGLSAYNIGKVVKNPGVRLDIDGKTVSF
jgi:phosphoribosylaminoimidazole (AIR) synthetase